MSLNYLCERITHAGHVLVGVQTRRLSTGFEAARIKDQGGFIAETSEGRNLRDVVLKQSSDLVTNVCAVYL